MDYRNRGVSSVSVASGGYGGTALIGGLDAPTPPVERATIGSALDRQGERLGAIIEILGKLESRLQPVLAPAGPGGEASPMPPPTNGVLETVQTHTCVINSAHARIGDMLDRLHL